MQVYGVHGSCTGANSMIRGKVACVKCGKADSEGWYNGDKGPLTVCQACHYKDRHVDSASGGCSIGIPPPHHLKLLAAFLSRENVRTHA